MRPSTSEQIDTPPEGCGGGRAPLRRWALDENGQWVRYRGGHCCPYPTAAKFGAERPAHVDSVLR